MRGIKPTPLKLYFIATPATDGAHSRNPFRVLTLSRPPSPPPLDASRLHAARSRLVSLSLARSCTIVYTTSQYGRVAKPPPSISRPSPILRRYRPSRRGVSSYNETPETSLRIRPSGGARYLSPDAFLSFGGVASPFDAAAVAPAFLLLFFLLLFRFFHVPTPMRDLPSR